ncbi:AA_TRNA_LIGASE_II domain-containing protein [Haematococcus lacustris]|uniref:AA_TRNA_LIGASE_II domain-containing protein n=1 Tax=Haematococcus lacustris TaxID=44745 RepID=A0A6A0A694_HAELA|nr:AA_TRNA_LIGASE_II domain-containing protein [Haematococcus lacustris]GFH27904.1 AA_TRNA_LIGASE_II domain-containing protein [Haematococcus lacustris]
MRRFGIRAEINGGASISKLVRTATKAKTPVTCIIGKQEVLDGTLSVRLYQGNKEIGALPQSEVIARVLQAVAIKGDFKSDPASQAREAAPARALHLEASVE